MDDITLIATLTAFRVKLGALKSALTDEQLKKYEATYTEKISIHEGWVKSSPEPRQLEKTIQVLREIF